MDFEEEVYKNGTFEEWKEKWMERITSQGKSKEELIEIMKKNNPSIIPRNYWVEKSIEEAESGDMSLFKEFLNALKDPFAHSKDQDKFKEIPQGRRYITYCGT